MSANLLDRTRPPEPGRVKAFAFPEISRARLDGADSPELLYARHGDLPLVTAELVVEAGAAVEATEQAGVAQLTAEALETGTRTRDVERLAWELESLGVELATGVSWDAASVGITVHADRFEPALELLAEIVRRPAFPSDQVERLRDERLADILQRRKEPRALASDAANRFIFRDGIPYGRPLIGIESTVRNLGPEQLADFHRTRYGGAAAALIVTGAIAPDAAHDVAARHFGDWRGEPAGHADFEVAPHVDRTTVFIVDRPGSVQSEIRLGHVGVDRHHPDYFPLVVMNTILGGAFTSRLNMNLRERHGFTYGVRSGFALRRRPGPFTVEVAVATDVTARAIEEALREIQGLREDGPNQTELDNARDYLRGVLPLRLQTTGALASRIAELVVFDLPSDYFQQYRDRIARVTREDVHRVARDIIRPERLAVVIVGDAAAIEQPVRDLELGPLDIHQNLP
jgi:zinc protease